MHLLAKKHLEVGGSIDRLDDDDPHSRSREPLSQAQRQSPCVHAYPGFP